MAYASFPIEQILEEEIRRKIQGCIAEGALRREVDDYFYDLVSFNVSATDYALAEERDLLTLAADFQARGAIADIVAQASQVTDLPSGVRAALARHSAEF